MSQIEVKPGEFIVSETDKHGKIVNVNDYFLEITGYTRDEVIGKPHNILRHPDMPKAAFAQMWQTIQSGKTWRGFVKNKTKNDDYYWVYATISHVDRMEGDAVYTSIRQKCTQNEIKKYEKLYAEMLLKEKTIQN